MVLGLVLALLGTACGSGPDARLQIELFFASNQNPLDGAEKLRVKVITEGGTESSVQNVDASQLFVPNVPLSGLTIVEVEALGPKVGGQRPVISRGRTAPLMLEQGEKRTFKMFFGIVGEVGTVGQLNIPRGAHAAAVLPDGRVLIAGGFNGPEGDPGALLASTEIYDPTTGVAVVSAPLQEPNAHQQATVLDDGSVLLSGGERDALTMNGHFFIYDPEDGGFRGEVPAAASPRIHHAAARIPGGALLVGGGTLVDTTLTPLTSDAQTSTLNPGNVSVTSASPMPRAYGTATALDPFGSDGRVFLSGGLDATPAVVPSQVFDSASGDTSTITGVLYKDRFNHAAVLTGNGTVLLIGGREAPQGVRLANIEEFDPGDNSFTNKPTLSIARERHRSVALADGSVVTIGGIGIGTGGCDAGTVDDALGTVEVFTASGSTITSCLERNAAQNEIGRVGHSATLLPDGTVLVAGGWTKVDPSGMGIQPSDLLEIYVPQ